MTNDAAILAFARSEAGDLPVSFHVDDGRGDAYAIARRNGRIDITGSNGRSCLHGLYHVQSGRPDGSFRAAFDVRGLNPCESLPCHTTEELRSLINKMGRWRMNTLIVHQNYGWKRHREVLLAECAKRGIEITFYLYTTIVFMPADMRVEWFSKDADGRPYHRTPVCESRLCVNEPAALDAFEAGARRFFSAEARDARNVVAQTGDGFAHCRCPRCAALSPVEQWQPLLERFIRAGRDLAPEKRLESLVYVQRYACPRNMAHHRNLDRIMFDLHQRNRWRPLGDDTHPATAHSEGDVDPRGAGMRINRYLDERLREWRSRCDGRIYLFENLQMHRAVNCPQPNTAVLLSDLRHAKELGCTGAVYEVLQGMGAFEEQFRILGDAMWDPDIPHTPTELEVWCAEHAPPDALFFLKRYDFPWSRFADAWDPAMRAHIRNIREVEADCTPANARNAIEHCRAHPDRFDRLNIAFRYLRQLHRRQPFSRLSPDEARFLSTVKLWDFMEPLDAPIEQCDTIVQHLLNRL